MQRVNDFTTVCSLRYSNCCYYQLPFTSLPPRCYSRRRFNSYSLARRLTMKASLTGKYEIGCSGGAGTLTADGGDVKLSASMTEAAFVKGPSLNGLILSLEKPGSFIVDYLPKQDVQFQFMDTVGVFGRPLNLTYTHTRRENRTALGGTLVIDSANKVSAIYAFDSGNCKLKYSYVQGGVRTFESCYDFTQNACDFSVSQRISDDDVVRASYHTSSRVLGLDWLRSSKFNGSFKISASLNLADEDKMPKLSAESTWNFEV